MSSTSRARDLRSASLLLAGLLALSGCGGASDRSQADEAPTRTTSPSTTAPGASEAPGEPVGTAVYTVDVPPRWKVNDSSTDEEVAVEGPTGDSLQIVYVSTFGTEFSLAKEAQHTAQIVPGLGSRPAIDTRGVSIGGQEGYVVRGRQYGARAAAYGATRDGRHFTVVFRTRGSEAHLRALERLVLPTWQWK